MISKHWQGAGADSFAAAADYDLSKGKRCRWLAGNVSPDPGAARREFEAVAGMRPDIEKPCFRIVLSLPPGDRLDEDRWVELAAAYLGKLGIDADNHQHSVVLHLDKVHQHVHITVNRVGLDASIWSRRNDGWKGRKAVAELERAFGLTLTSGDSADIRHPTQRERQGYRRTGLMPPRLAALGRVDAAYKKARTVPEFLKILDGLGVSVRANVSGGTVNGLSCSFNGHSFRASKLGRQFGWKALSTHLRYDPAVDLLPLRMRSQNPPSAEDVKREATERLVAQIIAEDEGPDELDAMIQELVSEAVETKPTPAPAQPAPGSDEALRQLVLDAAQAIAGKGVLALVEAVEARGIVVRANVARTGKVSGLAFARPGEAQFRSGSWVGKGLKWSNLARSHRFEGTDEEIEALRLRDGRWPPVPKAPQAGRKPPEARQPKVDRPQPDVQAARTQEAPTAEAAPTPAVSTSKRLMTLRPQGQHLSSQQSWIGLLGDRWPDALRERVNIDASNQLEVVFDDGTRVQDCGNEIIGTGDPKLIAQVMAIEAEAKGWRVVEASGTRPSCTRLPPSSARRGSGSSVQHPR